MSQIKFEARRRDGDVVTVQTGWDCPLQYCHFTVFDAEGEPTCEFPNPFDEFNLHNPEDVINRLDFLGVPFPSNLYDIIREHKENQVGNVLVRFNNLEEFTDEPLDPGDAGNGLLYEGPEFPTYVGWDGNEHGEY